MATSILSAARLRHMHAAMGRTVAPAPASAQALRASDVSEAGGGISSVAIAAGVVGLAAVAFVVYRMRR